jgi:hypothetical protein
LATNGVTGTEFANVLGAGQDDAKRASVKALDALSKIFAAIKIIEEEGPNAGADARPVNWMRRPK